jgi:hypothetical protein
MARNVLAPDAVELHTMAPASSDRLHNISRQDLQPNLLFQDL